MSLNAVLQIADAVLYEGYMLYPYRPSNVKNRQRWTIGGLYPEACAEASGDRSSFQTEVLVNAREQTTLEIKVRFLHLLAEFKDGHSAQLGMEREVVIQDVKPNIRRVNSFNFPASAQVHAGLMQRQEQVQGFIDAHCAWPQGGFCKLTVRVANTSGCRPPAELSREEASMRALIAAHAICHVVDGEFISLTEPPEVLRGAASLCVNDGVWPVLAGEPGSADWLLVSPIILYDYPQIAPESPGDLFDGTEIDEILSLRILTMTDQEKEEMCESEPCLRELLHRVESLSPEQMKKLHGALRSPRAFRMGGDA